MIGSRHMNNTRALIPVQGLIQPINGIEHKGIRNFPEHGRHQDGIIYRGYGPYGEDRIYGRSGKKMGDQVKNGEIIDIYV